MPVGLAVLILFPIDCAAREGSPHGEVRTVHAQRAAAAVGTRALASLGETFRLFALSARWAVRPPFDFDELGRQMVRIGVASVPVICFTAFFAGLVIGLQTYAGFVRFGAASFTGGVVAVSMLREIAPIFTAIMVTGRAGSAMAAEIGTMRTTEQIDALTAMGTEPVQYLFVPRILAGIIMVPVLQMISNGVGVLGGRVVTVVLLGANPVQYDDSTFRLLVPSDVTSGIIKSAVFGFLLTLISCSAGYVDTEGAVDVGRCATRAVVRSSLAILAADFFLSKLLY
jgi:phospholipid/cholesterol/gamma-HCH transport system permease protein